MPSHTTTCPDPGTWRAWLDQEAVEAEVDLPTHLARCPACRETVEELRASRELAARLLAPLLAEQPSTAETLLARERLHRQRLAQHSGAQVASSGASAQPLAREQPLARGLRRWRLALGGLAAALLLAVGVSTPAGGEVAAAFLAQFRSQRFAVVAIADPERNYQALQQLEQLGSLEITPPRPRVEQVDSLAVASQRVGFPVSQVPRSALPPGVLPTPSIRVSPATTVRFTFDQERASGHLRASGHAGVALPERFDGATLVVSVPAAVMLEYRGSDGSPVLWVGQARELQATVEGQVTLEDLRDFLLELPGLSPEAKAQLRAIRDWRNTLPIPVPADQVRWQRTRIAGTEGLMLTETGGLGNAVIWQRNGRVYGVAGLVGEQEIQRVASSLR